jgi:anaerobic selenocysteine-containing dehydrogenase
MAKREVVYSTCKSCHGGCGVKVTKEDGVIVHIEGNPDSLTGGTMCSKGLSSIQHIDNPYRLKYPMKQVGKKGGGKWERISWDEALDTIADKMKAAIADPGPQSIAISQGTGRGYNRYTMRLARSLGTGNAITPGYVCHSPRLGLYALVTGYGRLYCDYHGWGGEFPKTQIMWAKQLEISSADSEMCYWFMRSLDYCKNLIIIDPRASAYATRANLWIQPRPGTDCALAQGMMNVIIEEELWDKEFVDNWTYGFEELRERVKEWTPEKVSNTCWIPKEHVIEAARMWAIDTPGCIQVGSSLERQANCGHTLRAITCLMGLTGNIEAPGSMVSWVLPDTGLIEDFNLELPITDEMKANIIGGDRFKMGATRTCNPDTMVKKLLSGEAPIKVWFSVGGQQIVHLANTKEVVAAIEKVEFMSHTDLFMGPMAEAADIVLPAAHWLELDDVYDMHPRFMIEAHNRVVDPPGEAQSDAWIFNEIGRRVVPDKWWSTVEDMLDYQIRRGEGEDGGQLKWKEFSEKLVSGCWGPDQVYYKYKTDFWKEGGGFPTPSGKFEFKSQHLESLGYDGLPVFNEPGESPVSTPEVYKEFPLVMSSGYRQPFYFLGQYRNIPWLRSFMEFPTCQLHPETAKLYDVEDGDIIWIESPRGRIRQKLRTFPGIKKGVLMATANCFYPEEPAKGYHGVFISNPNVLTSNDHLDPMYGSPDLTCLLCKVYKAKDEELTEEVFRNEEYGFVPESIGATEAKRAKVDRIKIKK